MRSSLLLVAVSIFAMTTPAYSSSPWLNSAYTGYRTVTLPAWGAIGDFNGDGDPDLVALASTYSNTFSLWFGIGDGSFGSPETLSVANSYVYLAAGDLNGDGRDDLVASYPTARVFMSLPTGGFAAPVDVGPCDYFSLADVTGDGSLDIAMQLNSTQARVYPGNGSGGFAAAIDLTYSGSLGGVYTADLNNDGVADLTGSLRDPGGTVWLVSRLALGSGSFGPEVLSPHPNGVLYEVGHPADFDEDGAVDLVTFQGYVPGHGDGTFGALVPSGYLTLNGPVADFDGDGHLDLLDVHPDAGTSTMTLRVYRGHGDGSVEAPVSFPESYDLYWLDARDLNHDGRSDVASLSSTQAGFFVHLSHPTGGFGNALTYAAGSTPVAASVAELTGDGRTDAAVADPSGSAVIVLPGIGGGRLGTPILLAAPADIADVAIGDLNGDHVKDLVSANGSSNSISVYLGAGGGTFAARTDYPCPMPADRLAIGDLNGDGYADVAALKGNALSVWISSATGVLGTRQDKALAEVEAAVGILRVDADVYPDVIVTGGTRVSYYAGSATGTLGTRVDNIVTGPTSGSPDAGFGDVNGDGFVDVVLTSGTSIYVRVGNGSGGFTSLPSRTGARDNHGPSLYDLDEDGKLDLVDSNYGSGCVAVLHGNGDGTFDIPAVTFGSGLWPMRAGVADMDGDGHLDIVCPNQVSGTVTVLLNRTPGFTAVAPTAAATGLRLSRVGPVPARSDLRIAFTLPAQGRAALDLLDVAGRRVHAKELGELGPGEHSVVLGRNAAPRAGVYWLRLVQGTQHVSAKIVFVN